jgi:ribosome-associated protein
MDIRKLQRVIVDGLEDVKAQNIVVFNTEHLSPLFERVIVASGTSNRQTKSLAASVRDAVRAAGAPPPRTEGEDNGEWIIVDCGAAVVHVMQPAIRDYYQLEDLWGEKPVKMKIASAMPRLVKAEPASRELGASREAASPRAAAHHAAVAHRGTSAHRVAPARAGATAQRAAPPKRAATGRVTPSKRVIRSVGSKSGAAKKTTRASARPAAKRAAAKR